MMVVQVLWVIQVLLAVSDTSVLLELKVMWVLQVQMAQKVLQVFRVTSVLQV